MRGRAPSASPIRQKSQKLLQTGEVLRENNNALTDFIEAPGMGFYVEQSMYDMFNERLNQVGSYSFEDWVQWQVRVWNESFLEMSRFADLAEDGCLERVRVQKIEVWPDGTLCGGGNHVPNCQTNFLIDGEWGFLSSLQYAEKWSLLIERGLLHECTHQIGMIDLYTMNMEAGTPSSPLKVQVKDGRPYYISRGYYPAWGGLMGGGDTRYSDEYESTGLMSGWTIGALNTNTGYRRGFYGEQLYDVPDVLRLRAVDASGAAIPFAELKVWQSRAGATPDELLYDWQPIFEGVADETGVVTLPNYGTLESDPVTTITGHTLKPNPWGRTNVVGTNGSLLVKISGYGQYDYTFMRVSQINRQYWLGVTNELTYDLTVQIAPTYNLGLDNIAIGTSASSNAGGGPWYAVDGNLNTRWDIGSADVGDYLQVDLGEVHDLGWVILTQNDYAGDFFNKFRIDVSLTGAFTGEEVLFAHETVGWWNASGTRRDIDPDNESILRVRYAGPVTAARYVRLTCEDPRWTKLAELEIYPALPGDDTTPPAQVADLEVTDTSLSAAVLTWTTPGDDGWEGTATAYDLRYATFPLNPADFELATPAADVPTPWEGGLPETYVLGELQPGTQYWVALKAVDDVGNWSSMSNVVTFTTAPEGEPFEVETLTAPANSSFASGLASDTQHLYFLRRDDGSFYRTLDGTNWTTLVGPEADLGGWHGDWSSGILDYYPGMGDAGVLYITHRDTAGDDVQLLALYDIAEGFWYWTPKWPVFGHGATISGGYIYGLARSWGWNTGGATQRLHLTSPTQIYAERTALSGINGEADDWFSRASHLAALDGWIYGIKNDWTTPAGTGDRLFRFQTVDFEPSVCNGTLPDDLTNWDVWETHSTPAEDLAELPFEVGYGSALVALPPDWSPDVGSQGGLFIVAGNSPANNEGWGEASDICALFDIATRTLRVATLPGVTGNGTSAALHDGAVYVKRGQLPGGAYSDDIWRLTPLSVTTPGDTNCDGFVDFDDIHPFVKALSGPDEYYALYPDCDWMSADCDGNGAVDFDDIDDFISLIGG